MIYATVETQFETCVLISFSHTEVTANVLHEVTEQGLYAGALYWHMLLVFSSLVLTNAARLLGRNGIECGTAD